MNMESAVAIGDALWGMRLALMALLVPMVLVALGVARKQTREGDFGPLRTYLLFVLLCWGCVALGVGSLVAFRHS